MAEDTIYRFKHKTIRRFSTGRHDFKDFQITLVGDEARDAFLKDIETLPNREKLQIVEINVEAAAAAERPVSESQQSGVKYGEEALTTQSGIRGPMDAAAIQTSKDAGAAAQPNPTGGALASSTTPAKPAGFTGINLNK